MQMFQYNQEMAESIGGGSYVTKSGGFDLKVVRAQFVGSPTTKAGALEMDFETRDGLKCNYVSINHTSGAGQPNTYGQSLINAVMGVIGLQSLSQDQNGNCPELLGKAFKGILQRVDYTKNNGQDGYKFDLKLVADIQTGQTVKEANSNLQAESFQKYAEAIEDKDERQQQAPQTNTQSGVPTDFGDDDFDF